MCSSSRAHDFIINILKMVAIDIIFLNEKYCHFRAAAEAEKKKTITKTNSLQKAAQMHRKWMRILTSWHRFIFAISFARFYKSKNEIKNSLGLRVRRRSLQVKCTREKETVQQQRQQQPKPVSSLRYVIILHGFITIKSYPEDGWPLFLL